MRHEIRFNAFSGLPKVQEGDEFYLIEFQGRRTEGYIYQVYSCSALEVEREEDYYRVIAKCSPELDAPQIMEICRGFLAEARPLPVRWGVRRAIR